MQGSNRVYYSDFPAAIPVTRRRQRIRRCAREHRNRIAAGVFVRRMRHNVLLHVTGWELFDAGLAPRMVQFAMIDQSEEAIVCKATQVTP
jgi:hypothetical protein